MSIIEEIKAAVQVASYYRGDLFAGNVAERVVEALADAADAPRLRERVAELEATVTSLTAQVAQLTAANKRLQADYEFYFGAYCERPLATAEDAWGMRGGGD